jgi:hypothetical protein
MAIPEFRDRDSPGLASPATYGFAVTPHDTNELAAVTRGIWVGGAGDLSVVLADNESTAILISAVPAGTLLPLRARIIKNASTTATLIIGLL